MRTVQTRGSPRGISAAGETEATTFMGWASTAEGAGGGAALQGGGGGGAEQQRADQRRAEQLRAASWLARRLAVGRREDRRLRERELAAAGRKQGQVRVQEPVQMQVRRRGSSAGARARARGQFVVLAPSCGPPARPCPEQRRERRDVVVPRPHPHRVQRELAEELFALLPQRLRVRRV